MSFYDELQEQTSDERAALLSSEVIVDCLNGRVSLNTYTAFLTEAYHHVRHTVPLLMACGSRIPDRLSWLQKYVVDYIQEESGHEVWIEDDLRTTGADADALLTARPGVATELMISYAYDTIMRRNPIGFFGMVYVLEGTSVAIASLAADIIQRELALPDDAFRYLRSHGSIDQKHIATYAEIVNRLDYADDREAVTHAAGVFFELYARVFDGLPRADAGTGDRQGRKVA